MHNITALLIDDSKSARQSLKKLLAHHCPFVSMIADATDIDHGRILIDQLKPDLVFLDIKVGEGDGFEMLETFDQIPFHFIFTTTFSEYAIKAFQVKALDYLLKPIDPKLLKAAVSKAQQAHATNLLQNQVQQLISHIKSEQTRQLAISNLDGITFLDIQDIMHVKGSGNYSTFYTCQNEKIMASRNLRYYESLLPKPYFFRCHQSHLINLKYIKRILTREGNKILLKCGSLIPIARNRKEKLLSLISGRFCI